METKFVCNICEKTFRSSYRLKSHEKNHNELTSFKCEICEKSFVYWYKFKTHQDTHKNIATCEICDLKFSCESRVKQHQENRWRKISVVAKMIKRF